MKPLSSNVGADGSSRGGNKVTEPVIAAVEGHCVAGGPVLTVWCDLRVCGETAIFGEFCRQWGMPLIDVGQSRALDMLLTGRPVAAAEALSFGLASRVVPHGGARAGAQALAAQIASFPDQACMRVDRPSALEQRGLPGEGNALLNEYRLGGSVLRGAVAGAGRFRDAAGRGGNLINMGKSKL